MLTIPQLKRVEATDPYLYEALRKIVGAVNSLGQRVGIDPLPAQQAVSGKHLPAPGAPAAIGVTAARGTFTLALSAPAGSTTPIFFFVEAASEATFQPQNTAVYPLGGALTANISLGNVTRYWRARAKYVESDYGPYLYLGTAANPTGVTGGLANSNDIAFNPPSNAANFATVDSIDAGTSATIRIYGPGGVGSSWTQNFGQGTRNFPAGTITGRAYTTTYYVVWDTVNSVYVPFISFANTVNDNYVFVGKVTTVAAGGTGGTPGGGGGGGSVGGCCEVGTPLKFPEGARTSIQLEACNRWIEFETDSGRRLCVAVHTLVSTFTPGEKLEEGQLVELEEGAFERVKRARVVENPSHKMMVKVSPQQTYWANGIRVHNLKML